MSTDDDMDKPVTKRELHEALGLWGGALEARLEARLEAKLEAKLATKPDRADFEAFANAMNAKIDSWGQQLSSEIKQIGEEEANCRRLTSVPGIGPLISTAVVAAIGTGEAFERGRDFGAWLGLVPRQYSTGRRSILGRISKRGSKYLRTLFIQAANVILMRPHNWDRFSFGTWLQNASLRMHRNKLATALANKLARIAWSILRNEKTFDVPSHEVMAI